MAEWDLQKLMTEAADERRNIATTLLAIQKSLDKMKPMVSRMEPVLASLEQAERHEEADKSSRRTAVAELELTKAAERDVRMQLGYVTEEALEVALPATDGSSTMSHIRCSTEGPSHKGTTSAYAFTPAATPTSLTTGINIFPELADSIASDEGLDVDATGVAAPTPTRPLPWPSFACSHVCTLLQPEEFTSLTTISSSAMPWQNSIGEGSINFTSASKCRAYGAVHGRPSMIKLIGLSPGDATIPGLEIASANMSPFQREIAEYLTKSKQNEQDAQRKRTEEELHTELEHFLYHAFDMFEGEHVGEVDIVALDAEYVLSSLKEAISDGKLSLCHFSFGKWINQISKEQEHIFVKGITDLPLLQAVTVGVTETLMFRTEKVGNSHRYFRHNPLNDLKLPDTTEQHSEFAAIQWGMVSTEERKIYSVHIKFLKPFSSWDSFPFLQECTIDAKLIIQWDPGVENNREIAWISLLHPVTMGVRLILPWGLGNFRSEINTEWLALQSGTTNVKLLFPWDPGEQGLIHVQNVGITVLHLASTISYNVQWKFACHEEFKKASGFQRNDFSLVFSPYLVIVHPVLNSETDLQLIPPDDLMGCTISLSHKEETPLLCTSWSGKIYYVAPTIIDIWRGWEKLVRWTQYSLVIYLPTYGEVGRSLSTLVWSHWRSSLLHASAEKVLLGLLKNSVLLISCHGCQASYLLQPKVPWTFLVPLNSHDILAGKLQNFPCRFMELVEVSSSNNHILLVQVIATFVDVLASKMPFYFMIWVTCNNQWAAEHATFELGSGHGHLAGASYGMVIFLQMFSAKRWLTHASIPNGNYSGFFLQCHTTQFSARHWDPGIALTKSKEQLTILIPRDVGNTTFKLQFYILMIDDP